MCWETLGSIWHGHELIGIENIPDTGPALFIYYHAAMPIDFYYVHSKIVLYKNRRMKIVCDRFLFKGNFVLDILFSRRFSFELTLFTL